MSNWAYDFCFVYSETDGLPKWSNFDKVRIVKTRIELYNKKKRVHKKVIYVKTEKKSFESESYHGITPEICNKKGISVSKYLKKLDEIFRQSGVIITYYKHFQISCINQMTKQVKHNYLDSKYLRRVIDCKDYNSNIALFIDKYCDIDSKDMTKKKINAMMKYFFE